jgi:hypothetical protein
MAKFKKPIALILLIILAVGAFSMPAIATETYFVPWTPEQAEHDEAPLHFTDFECNFSPPFTTAVDPDVPVRFCSMSNKLVCVLETYFVPWSPCQEEHSEAPLHILSPNAPIPVLTKRGTFNNVTIIFSDLVIASRVSVDVTFDAETSAIITIHNPVGAFSSNVNWASNDTWYYRCAQNASITGGTLSDGDFIFTATADLQLGLNHADVDAWVSRIGVGS